METDGYSSRQALDDALAMRRRAAERIQTPWWYHPILGIIMAVLVAQLGIDLPVWGSLALAAACIVAVVLLVRAYTRLTGVWVGPDQFGQRARPIFRAYQAGVAVLVVVAVVTKYATETAWPAVVAGVLMLVLTVAMGPLLDQRLREDVAAGASGS